MSVRKGFIAFALIFIALVFFMMRPRYRPDVGATYSRESFIEAFAPLAQEVAHQHHLVPSVVLAQAAVESNFGESVLSKQYNNYFGIKGKGENAVILPTMEIENGEEKMIRDGFRSYNSARDSFYDYAQLIAKAPRYAPVREAKTKEEYAMALYPAGYSTNPNYGEILLNTIANYQLDQYDE